MKMYLIRLHPVNCHTYAYYTDIAFEHDDDVFRCVFVCIVVATLQWCDELLSESR